MVRKRKEKKKTINLNPQRNSLVTGEMTRRPTTQEDMDRVREQMRITERNTGRRPTREDERIVSNEERAVRERTSSRNRRSETKQKPEEIVLNQPKKEKGFIEETVENVKGLGEAIINPSWATKEEQEEFSEASEAPMLRGLALAGGLAAAAGAFTYALGSSAATVGSLTAGQVSRMGLTKMTGKASNVIAGKFVPMSTKAGFGMQSAAKYAANTKTVSLTKSMLLKRGFQGSVVAFIVGIFGSYPMAAWAKQEVLGGLKINARDAREEGDFQTAEEMIALREEIHKVDWHDFIPYENVLEKFREFTKADILAVKSEKRLLMKARGEIEFEGKNVGEQIAERDEERDAARDKRDKEFKQSEKERGEAEEREARIKQEVWRIRRIAQGLENKEERDKKYDEADALELTIYE